ncbi:MAG: 3-hydroxyacyl-ACP dehydratase FabZ [Vampirovibrionales bacterium]|nr:3-hydroxyacyl-ACP dehydratase FabZ [Vampirovibrionales bacterium]
MTPVQEKPVENKQADKQIVKTMNDDYGQSLAGLDINQLSKILPHRYPFLLVDRVTEHISGQSIKGYKNVTMNEPFFQGHFPNNPIMPGVLQLEALAQLGGILVKDLVAADGKLMVFAGLDNVRFRRLVIPGDRLDMECAIVKFRNPIGKSACKAFVNGEVAVEAEIMFSLINDPNTSSES